MSLFIIGLGLNDQKDISVKGLELVKRSGVVYLENYTSILSCSVEELEKFYSKKIILADRELVEKQAEQTILDQARHRNVSFLVVGDALTATTHADLLLRAEKAGIDVEIVHNASVYTAVARTGLQLYNFGKTTSIPFFEEYVSVETPYNVLEKNLELGLHTLFLLDLDPSKERFMTVNDGIEVLLKIEAKKKHDIFNENAFCVGCARLGRDDFVIKAGPAKELLAADFGKPPHCLIVPGKMHFMEEEFLAQFH